jgi:integrase
MHRLRHIVRDVSRHGQVRLYFRVSGAPKVRIDAAPGSAAFHATYAALLARHRAGLPLMPATPGESAAAPVAARRRVAGGTLQDLVDRYRQSEAWHALDETTRHARAIKLTAMLREPVDPDTPGVTFAAFPLPRLTTPALAVLRDRVAARAPSTANDRVKILRGLFRWAAATRPPEVPVDLAAELRKVETPRTGGFHTWTEAEIAAYEARWPLGTRPRLVFDVALYTGARRSDIVRLGRQHERHETHGVRLAWTCHKNRAKRPRDMDIPLLAPLRASLDAGPVGDLTYVVNAYGRPYSGKSIGSKFKVWAVAAGVPHGSLHGLRKAGSVRAAEAGATAHELMAMYGWTTLAQAERYTRTAERRRMATRGMAKLLRVAGGGATETGRHEL